MKEHASIFMLLARSTFSRVLAIFAVLAAADMAAFFLLALDAGQAIEQVFNAAKFRWLFSAALLGISLLLSVSLAGSGSKVDYTLRRLRVGRKALFLWQSGYNTLIFLLLWMVQTFLAFAMCLICVERLAIPSNQAILLAFYRDSFLHSLLPLDDFPIYLRNLAFFMTLGIVCACHPISQRRGKSGLGAVVGTALAISLFFCTGMGNAGGSVLGIVVCVFAALICVCVTWGEACDHED